MYGTGYKDVSSSSARVHKNELPPICCTKDALGSDIVRWLFGLTLNQLLSSLTIKHHWKDQNRTGTC